MKFFCNAVICAIILARFCAAKSLRLRCARCAKSDVSESAVVVDDDEINDSLVSLNLLNS